MRWLRSWSRDLNTKYEYEPKPRFVVELTKPKVLAFYMNGKQVPLESVNPTISVRNGSFGQNITVEVTLEDIQMLTGMDYDYGPIPNMELVFLDDK